MEAPIRLGEEVRDSLDAGLPVVALETSIVTQGMPYPVNLETAGATAEAVRRGGAVPARDRGDRRRVGMRADRG